MARRTGTSGQRMMPADSSKAKRYPSIAPRKLPPPPPGTAFSLRGVQLALWARVKRSIVALTITAICVVGLILLALFTDTGGHFAGFLIFVCVIVGLISALSGIVGLIRTARLFRMLRRHEWTVYTINEMSVRESLPNTVTLVGADHKTYPLRFTKTKRAEILRGMQRPEVWFAGDPQGRGIFTAAGGGEMFVTKPYRVRPLRTRKPTPAKPRKPPKPVTPEQARKLAAKAAAARVKQDARMAKIKAKQQAAAAKAKLKPPKPAKPARPAKPAKPPRLPKIRGGQKIKWQ